MKVVCEEERCIGKAGSTAVLLWRSWLVEQRELSVVCLCLCLLSQFECVSGHFYAWLSTVFAMSKETRHQKSICSPLLSSARHSASHLNDFGEAPLRMTQLLPSSWMNESELFVCLYFKTPNNDITWVHIDFLITLPIALVQTGVPPSLIRLNLRKPEETWGNLRALRLWHSSRRGLRGKMSNGSLQLRVSRKGVLHLITFKDLLISLCSEIGLCECATSLTLVCFVVKALIASLFLHKVVTKCCWPVFAARPNEPEAFKCSSGSHTAVPSVFF